MSLDLTDIHDSRHESQEIPRLDVPSAISRSKRRFTELGHQRLIAGQDGGYSPPIPKVLTAEFVNFLQEVIGDIGDQTASRY